MVEVNAKGKEVVTRVSPPVKDRREALLWLLERLAGKPRQVVEMEGEQASPGFVIMLRDRLGSVDPMARTRRR